MPDELPPRGDPDPMPRPGLPPSLGDRVRALLESHGISGARILAVAAGLVVVTIGGWWLLRPPPTPVESELPRNTAGTGSAVVATDPAASTGSASTTTVPAALVVDAAGAVIHPGLYRVRAGARVADVIGAAGGLAPDADPDRINLAAPVADGQRIYILKVGEVEVPEAAGGDGPVVAATGGGNGSATSDPPPIVDLNTATADQLDALPGVGPSTAQAIITYRAAHGRFTSVDDLLNVRGIGPAKLAQLRPQARV